MTPTSDSASPAPLLDRFLRGEASAHAQVRRWAWEILYFKPYHIPGDEHEDIVQQAVMHVWRAASREGFTLAVDLRAFVRSVTMARCIDWIRRRRPSVEIDDAHPDAGPSAYDTLLEKDERAQLRWAVTELEDGCRRVIQLHFYDDLPYAAIAEREGRAEGTMRWRVFQCLKRLREIVGRWRGEAPAVAPHDAAPWGDDE